MIPASWTAAKVATAAAWVGAGLMLLRGRLLAAAVLVGAGVVAGRVLRDSPEASIPLRQRREVG